MSSTVYIPNYFDYRFEHCDNQRLFSKMNDIYVKYCDRHEEVPTAGDTKAKQLANVFQLAVLHRLHIAGSSPTTVF